MNKPSHYTITYSLYQQPTQTIKAVRSDIKSAMKHAYHINKNYCTDSGVRVCEGDSGLPVATIN